MKNQNGQAALETVLLFALILTLWMTVLKGLKSQQFFASMFGTPWARLVNTVEFGIPTSSNKQTANKHPSAITRHAANDPSKGGG